MNSERRKRLAKICEQLEEIQVEIQAIADEEQECYDNLPESLQYAERGERMIENKAVGVQATMERLVNEGKIAQDYIAPIGVELRRNDHSPIITFS